MKNKPAISVIMSVYNGEDYLKEAAESIINQTFKDWELIIVNDCSSDNTANILNELSESDERIRIVTNEVNLKLPTSLNKAISLAEGEFVARMDSDDIALAERLQKQYDFMKKNPDVHLSSCRFMTLKGNVISSGGCGGRCDDASLRALLLVTNPILHPGVIAKTETMKKLMYDVTLTCSEDLEMWIRFSEEGYKMEILPEYLMLYRLHDKQITSTTLERQHKEVLKIQNGYFGKMLSEMSEEMQNFYISGIYFREAADINKFCEFYKFLKRENKKTKAFDNNAIRYAMFEILSEYKRSGIGKGEILKAMTSLGLCSLIKEFLLRKERALKEGRKCIAAAESLGLKKTGGSETFPVFSER